MSAKLTITGLHELAEELAKLPAALQGEGKQIVIAAANGAATSVRAAYGAHRRSGELQEDVEVNEATVNVGGAAALVSSRAPYARAFERGTKPRQTAKGWNRGRMPRANLFIPRMIAARRAMRVQLVDLVRRHGLAVSDDGS